MRLRFFDELTQSEIAEQVGSARCRCPGSSGTRSNTSGSSPPHLSRNPAETVSGPANGVRRSIREPDGGSAGQRRRRRRAPPRSRTRASRPRPTGCPLLLWASGAGPALHLVQRPVARVHRPVDGRRAGPRLARRRCTPTTSTPASRLHRRRSPRQESFSVEYRLRRADGEYRWMLDHGVPWRSRDGTFLGYAGLCVDVHETRTTLEEFRLRERQQAIVADLGSLRARGRRRAGAARHRGQAPRRRPRCSARPRRCS